MQKTFKKLIEKIILPKYPFLTKYRLTEIKNEFYLIYFIDKEYDFNVKVDTNILKDTNELFQMIKEDNTNLFTMFEPENY